MADLGVLARLTQQASDNIFREHNFRSSLFAQARQELQTDRQLRLQESNAIANRMNQAEQMAEQRRYNDIRGAQNAARLAQQKAYQDARLKQLGTSSGFGGYVPLGAGGVGAAEPGAGDTGTPIWGHQPPPNIPPDEVGKAVGPGAQLWFSGDKSMAEDGQGRAAAKGSPVNLDNLPSQARSKEEQEGIFQLKGWLIKAKADAEAKVASVESIHPGKDPGTKNAANMAAYNEDLRIYNLRKSEAKAEMESAGGALERVTAVKDFKPDEGLSSADEQKFHESVTEAQRWGGLAQQEGQVRGGVKSVRVGDDWIPESEILLRRDEALRKQAAYASRMTPAQIEANASAVRPSQQGTAGPNPDILREKAKQGNAPARNLINILK